MPRILPPILFFCLALVITGCKDTHQSLSKKMNDKMLDVVAILKDVKDEASSKAAAAKLNAMGDDMKDIEKRMSALPQPSDDEIKKSMEYLEKTVSGTIDQLQKEMVRIATTPKLMTPELEKALGGPGGMGGLSAFSPTKGGFPSKPF